MTGAVRPRARSRRCAGGELGRQRLDPDPIRQVLVAGRRAEDEVAGAEPARVDVDERGGRRRARRARACAVARPAGRTGASRSSAGAGAGSDRARATRSGTCRRGSGARRRRRAARPRRPRAGRPRPARIEDLGRPIVAPSTCGASWRRIVSTSGSSGTVSYASMQPQTNDSPGSPTEAKVLSPPSHASTLAPTSASGSVVPARAVPRERGQQRRVLARVIGSRRRSGRSRGRRSGSAGPRSRAAPATRDARRRSRAARAVKPGDVVPVTVDLIGLDQVREHEPERRASRSARSSPASARAFVAPGCWTSIPTPANSCPTLPTVWTATPASWISWR